MLTLGPILHTLRLSTLITLSLNAAVASLGGALLTSIPSHCRRIELVSPAGAAAAAVAKIVCMIGAGVTQGAVASTIAGHSISASFDPDRDFHLIAQARYKRWLWWTRLGIAITIVQFAMAVFLLLVVANDLTSEASQDSCFSGKSWRQDSIIAFLVIAWVVVVMQCVSGSEVLRWRSFYASHDAAWRAHYREVFDYGIREVLCCLGRIKYMSVMEDDEVYMVARLLGDLMAYRASGTGHLELLAGEKYLPLGLALLQKHKRTPVSYDDHIEAPYIRMKEASFFHQFAEAAYTGPLLDLGRHPLTFPCVWIYRQGTFSLWSRNRRPFLEGDNCWRGHAAAFLKYVNLSPDTLRKGRIRQTKHEAAYFVVVLHDLKTVLIAVRGTETPEDLITDGLCRECPLTMDDLDGLINSNKLDPSIKEKLLSSFPRFGHSGIIESARELYRQIDGKQPDRGCLSSLLDEGSECHGYRIRIVGHSLGGSVAAVLGIMLYGHYPNLRVYSYGPLPCLDPILAEACSQFVTSIVYNDEFSARLSVNSIIRLRVAAVRALSSDSSRNISLLPNLVRKIANVRKESKSGQNQLSVPPVAPANSITVSENGHGQIHNRNLAHTIRGGVFLCGHAMSCVMHSDSYQHQGSVIGNTSADVFAESNNEHRLELSKNPLEEVQASIANPTGMQSAEVYLPGLVVHLVRIQRSGHKNPILRSLKLINDKRSEYKAFIVNRERFMDIVVSPCMFLDHLPWRCQYAMQKVLESQEHRQNHPDFSSGETNV